MTTTYVIHTCSPASRPKILPLGEYSSVPLAEPTPYTCASRLVT